MDAGQGHHDRNDEADKQRDIQDLFHAAEDAFFAGIVFTPQMK